MALFNTHHAKRLAAISASAKFLASLNQRPEHGVTITCRHGNFISQFTGKRDTEQTRTQPTANSDGATGHKWEGLIRYIKLSIDNFTQQVTRIWSGYRILRP